MTYDNVRQWMAASLPAVHTTTITYLLQNTSFFPNQKCLLYIDIIIDMLDIYKNCFLKVEVYIWGDLEIKLRDINQFHILSYLVTGYLVFTFQDLYIIIVRWFIIIMSQLALFCSYDPSLNSFVKRRPGTILHNKKKQQLQIV